MGVQLISAKDISMYMDDKTLLIDMRSEDEFAACHLKNAISVPFDDDYEKWKKILPENDRYILYCDRGNASLYAGKQLDAAGVLVYAVAGGMEAIGEICKRQREQKND